MVKNNLEVFLANNPRPRSNQDLGRLVTDKEGTKVIKIPKFKCMFCGKSFTKGCNLSRHVELNYALAIAATVDQNRPALPTLGI